MHRALFSVFLRWYSVASDTGNILEIKRIHKVSTQILWYNSIFLGYTKHITINYFRIQGRYSSHPCWY